MRFSFPLAFLTISVFAQPPQIKVETHYDTVAITNLNASPVTALIVWAPLEEPLQRRAFSVMQDSVTFEPGGAPRVIIGAGERRLLHVDGRSGISVGVIFADGKSAGDPEAVQKLRDHRREMALAISSVLAAIRPLVQAGESRSAVIARVEQFGQQERTAVAITPGAPAAILVSKKTADLLRANDEPLKVIAALERWRERVEEAS